MTIETKTIDFIRTELESIAPENRKQFNSTYEGFGVLKSQVDDLWYQLRKGEKRIKKQLRFEGNGLTETVQHYHKIAMREEAVKVAAMAVRFIQELTKIEGDAAH